MERAAVGALGLALVATAGCGPPEPTGHPPYWTVERGGRPSVLLGTMHAEVDADALAPELWGELEAAAVLTTEADVRSIGAAELERAVTLAAGESVRAAVSTEDWAAIVEALDGVLSEEVADRLQPWFLEGQIVRSLLPPSLDPIDATLVARAEAAGVPLAFLEPWRHQVALLNDLGFEDGLAALVRTARDPDGALAAHLLWAEAYESGDVDRMTALAFDPDAVAARPAYYDTIVFRHEAWLPAIEAQLSEGGAFVAVGFMHLLTGRGLPALLEARGWQVTLVAPRPD